MGKLRQLAAPDLPDLSESDDCDPTSDDDQLSDIEEDEGEWCTDDEGSSGERRAPPCGRSRILGCVRRAHAHMQ
jgi:hypothetical protein